MVAALTGCVAVILLCLRLATPLARVDNQVSPITALAATPAEIRARPVLNQYGFGGYLIWSDIKPFIDSRAELYKDEGLAQYGQLMEGDERALDHVLTSQNIGWAIFSPKAKINAVLDRKPGWRRLYADKFAVVYARQK